MTNQKKKSKKNTISFLPEKKKKKKLKKKKKTKKNGINVAERKGRVIRGLVDATVDGTRRMGREFGTRCVFVFFFFLANIINVVFLWC